MAVVAAGILLRLVEWGRGRAFWGDEAMLALNLLQRDYLQLLEPLSYSQGAPYGFLYAMKSAVLLLGNHEWAFRLVPLLSGLLSLILFYKLSRLLLNPLLAFLAILQFSMMGSLIYYSAETKQYSTDVMMAVAMLLMFVAIEQKGWTWKRTVAMAFVGSIGIWFSHPLIFVLVGIGLTQMIFLLNRREVRETRFILFCGVLWVVNFSLFYIFSLHTTATDSSLINSWARQDAFMPVTAKLPQWLALNFTYLLFYRIPLLTILFPVTALLWFAGMHQLWRQRRKEFWLYAAIIVLVLVASALKKYPFRGRFLLFLSPVFIVAVTQGISAMTLLAHRWLRVVGYSFAAAMIGAVIYGGFHPQLVNPKPDVRESIRYVAAQSKEKDFVCPRFMDLLIKYYAERNDWKHWSTPPTHKSGYLMKYTPRLSAILQYLQASAPDQKMHRIWIVTGCHLESFNIAAQELVEQLDGIGERIEHRHYEGSHVYLYALDNNAIRRHFRRSAENRQQEKEKPGRV